MILYYVGGNWRFHKLQDKNSVTEKELLEKDLSTKQREEFVDSETLSSIEGSE
jgi:hypothetical protein